MSNWRRRILMSIAVLTSLILDLLSKYWAHTYLQPGLRQVFIPGVLNLTLVTNTGFAFSIWQGHPLLAKIIATTIFMGIVWIYARRYLFMGNNQHPWLEQLGMSMIIGAALGNLWQRLYYGRVTDFLEFAFMSFPVFNLADTIIDIGIVLIFISIYSAKRKA